MVKEKIKDIPNGYLMTTQSPYKPLCISGMIR